MLRAGIEMFLSLIKNVSKVTIGQRSDSEEGTFMENEIAEGIYWIGAHFPDPDPGVSINCFLIKDEKTMVIDTGAPATADLILSNITKLVDPQSIDYIMITHADVDHIGGLNALLREAPQATLLASPYEARGLGYWALEPTVSTIADGERLSLGRRQLRFVEAPYSCMPRTMLVFEETEGILFSADLYAALGPKNWELFADGDLSEMLKGVQEIKLGNTHHTKASLQKIKELPVNMIASAHGSMIKSNIGMYTDLLIAEIK